MSISYLADPDDSLPPRVPFWRLVFNRDGMTEKCANYIFEGTGTDEDPYQVSWLEDDVRDPMNFSLCFKWALTLLVGLDTFAIALVSSAYSGALRALILDLHISDELSIIGISVFVAGFAIGPLVWAPLSEMYGRRLILIASSVGLTAFTAGAAAAQNIEGLLVVRFFGGAIGSAPFAVAGGVIADCFPAISRGLATGFFCCAPFLGPTVGPIIGGFLSEAAGWRWVQGLVAIFSGVVTILLFFCLPETYSPVLLRQRAQRLSKKTGQIYRSHLDIKHGKKSAGEVIKVAMSRPWVLLFREPIVLLLSIYLAIIYGILYMLFAAMPIVYQEYRGWGEGLGGLAFMGILIGILIASGSTFPIYLSYKKKALLTRRPPSPEERLPPAFIGAVALPAGLFWFAWTNSPSIHWLVSIASGVPFGFGMVMVFLPVANYLVDSYTIFTASVMAANSLLRSIFGVVFPLFTKYMYQSLGIHWATSLVAFLALACLPMPFIFYQYGPAIRRRCYYSAQSEAFMAMLYEKTPTPSRRPSLAP
ncbi:MFS general substrate transporter [Penicillium capsulatum]|uniref:MFS general substrate transporter n=1 Tax=Penicillium capsulatum TaxID=69766 RepID=A0A9W9HUS2_9EURO|nr:MFS general substrate transporter [Penicillium capsulatum]KAJ6105617.1 MFS general substrate transporter [Penicillium capsulatum]